MSAAPGSQTATKQTILVVDDAGLVRLRCRRFLAEHGYEVLEAENGLEAVAKYKQARPDAVLLDVTMPEMDGLTALKEIRKFDPEANVVMVTGMHQQAVIMDALKCGAKDFVLKPFQPDRVLSAVEKLFN
ncbi:MAG TPA: response regulator [Chloroflexota bacterium]|nr:response regulator [Chloroflexota bacterium]